MQARKLRKSLSEISDGLHQWASKTLLVAGAYKQLADLITDTPTQLTDNKVFHGMCSELSNSANLNHISILFHLTQLNRKHIARSKGAVNN